jgi:phosphatidylserine/phosphatidylglycerophosphate/cardiolipin synthase-like enzyme
MGNENKVLLAYFFRKFTKGMIFMRFLFIVAFSTLAFTVEAVEVQTFFSMMEDPPSSHPRHGEVQRKSIAEKLISAIKSANTRVFIAIYSITHDEISSAIVYAARKTVRDKDGNDRKVNVRVIADQTAEGDRNGQVKRLIDQGIKVRIFSAGKVGARASLMHNKYAIIDDYFWTGSFNFTKAAQDYNQENAVIIKGDKTATERAIRNFDILWKCSDPGPRENFRASRDRVPGPPIKRPRHND